MKSVHNAMATLPTAQAVVALKLVSMRDCDPAYAKIGKNVDAASGTKTSPQARDGDVLHMAQVENPVPRRCNNDKLFLLYLTF